MWNKKRKELRRTRRPLVPYHRGQVLQAAQPVSTNINAKARIDGHLAPNENLLEDSYPVYGDYLYVVDGRVIRSDVFGTVRDLKRSLISREKTANEVRRCNMAARGLI